MFHLLFRCSFVFLFFFSVLPITGASGSCPPGLPDQVLLEWQVISSSGESEVWFESFEYLGPYDGHPAWRSTFHDEDGSTRMIWDYSCVAGSLVAVGQLAGGLYHRYDLAAASRSWTWGPAEIVTPAGLFSASLTETFVQAYDEAGDHMVQILYSTWYGRSPELIPVQRSWTQRRGSELEGLDMVLISVRRGLRL